MAPITFFFYPLLPETVYCGWRTGSMRGDPREKRFVTCEMLYSESGSVGTKDLFGSSPAPGGESSAEVGSLKADEAMHCSWGPDKAPGGGSCLCWQEAPAGSQRPGSGQCSCGARLRVPRLHAEKCPATPRPASYWRMENNKSRPGGRRRF